MTRGDVKNSNTQTVSPFFQIIFIVLTLAIITGSVYWRLIGFFPIDESPPIKYFMPEQLSVTSERNTVQVGLFIRDFTKFDILRNDFVMSAIIWFVFDPETISVELLEKFSFENGEIIDRSTPHVRGIGKKIFVYYSIKVHFTSALSYRYFPVDDHRIYIVLTHEFVNPQEMRFEATVNDFLIRPDLKFIGWVFVNKNVESGYGESVLNELDPLKTVKKSKVIFDMGYSRIQMRTVISIVLPLLFIFFLALFVFSLDPRKSASTVLSLSASSITAMLAYRFVIETMSPNVGYFMMSDYFFFLFLISIFIIFILALISTRLSLMYKKIAIIALHSFVIISSCYLLFIWST